MFKILFVLGSFQNCLVQLPTAARRERIPVTYLDWLNPLFFQGEACDVITAYLVQKP